MVLPAIGGMAIPSRSLRAIHPSRTSMRSLRHSSIVSPVAMTPRRPEIVAQKSPSSIGSYSARERAAWMYSENIAEISFVLSQFIPFSRIRRADRMLSLACRDRSGPRLAWRRRGGGGSQEGHQEHRSIKYN